MSNIALNRTVVAMLTNKSGGAHAQGDVCVIDSANASAVVNTTTSAYIGGQIAVCLDPGGVADNAIGSYAVGGFVPKVNLSGSASLGDLFKTHTVAKQAVRHAAPIVAGDFGIVLNTGTTPPALLFGLPALGGGGGGGNVSTGATVTIGELAGSPERTPASPSATDDEFETLSGWTTLGTLDTSNVTDFPSHWHVKRVNAGVAIDGIYKAAPSMPFTVTAKLKASNVAGGANYNMAGILLTESSPGKCTTFGLVSNTATYYASIYRWTNRTTLATNIDTSLAVSTLYNNQFPYLRLVVASSTDISAYVSRDGFLWIAVTSQQNVTSGLTIANVGLAIGDAAAAGTVEAAFDWIRFS